jgi:hypothetical protein
MHYAIVMEASQLVFPISAAHDSLYAAKLALRI